MRRSPSQTTSLEADILKRVRASERISRVELARSLALAPSTAGIYVERLLAEGFLLETEEITGESGRPPRFLRPNPEGGEFIGVDFEARNILAVAVDFADRPLRNVQKAIEPGDSAEDVIRKIENAIKSVLPPGRGRLLAIGVGVPGIVDPERGVAVQYKFIPGWEGVGLAERLSKLFAVPVFLENNARSMALAELWFGQGKGLRDFMCLGIRNGVGAGMVLDGGLYSGARDAAGEVGRWPCPPLPDELAGHFGVPRGEGVELQEVASARALLKALQKAVSSGRKSVLSAKKEPIGISDVVGACQQRDPLALRIVETSAGALGWSIANLALALDPSKVILAGPLTALGDAFVGPARAEVVRIMAARERTPPEIVNSAMGEFSGALGAAALALHQWVPPGVKREPAKPEPRPRGGKRR